ncbi:MAG: hypothetical protein ACD_79C00182G0004 [uncultured bacterium]|nr:MAG: hypothetical protein ACD_79C00182G0004 [uncultured bacterium]
MSAIPKTQKERLQKLGIRHFDELIHEQPKEWLHNEFSSGSSNYPVNVSRLIRNIIWQIRERILEKEKEPLKELIRTFWYMYIKPTLTRAGALSDETDQYNQLIQILSDMVKEYKIMEYKDIGFRDDNRANRKVGLNANIILYAEKVGHADFLSEVAEKYQVSILAFGGQPSVMNIEYFVDDLKSKGVDLRTSFFIFSIVDFDPSGWIIRNSFIDDLKRFGISNIKNTELIHPDMLMPDEILLSRVNVNDNKETTKKNTAWLKEIKQYNYKNFEYIQPETDQKRNRIIYGLESEAVSSKRINLALDELLPPLLGKDDRLLKIAMFEKLNQNIKDLMILKLT